MAGALDALGRPVISDAVKEEIKKAFAAVPEDKRGAVLVVADEHGTRGMLAWKLGGKWKVAAGAGYDWKGKQPTASVSVAGTW